MKIFGKRKRPSASEDASKSVGDESPCFEAKSSNLEVLKQDPSSWNAKQRRLVRRLQQRTSLGNIKKNFDKDSADGALGVDCHSEVNEEMKESGVEQEIVQEVPSTDRLQSVIAESIPTIAMQLNTAEDNQQVSESPKILEDLVSQLSSKMRRKLMRQYERSGDLDATLSEVRNLLSSSTSSSGIDSKTNESAFEKTFAVRSENVSSDPSPSSLKRRDKSVDWSSLPPEERLRREDQRRRQKEAAEQRLQMTALGVDAMKEKLFRHPLNSERRRANRRKPKHTSHKGAFKEKESSLKGNEHDTSGFLMRQSMKSTNH